MLSVWQRKRINIFREKFSLTYSTTILDYGSGDGKYIAEVIRGTRVKIKNVYCYDILPQRLVKDFNYLPALPNRTFDIVFCNSVIEHVNDQSLLAYNINTYGDRFFVQTPARYFPIESHCKIPFAGYLSSAALSSICKTYINLLDKKAFQKLFFDAEIIEEKAFGLVKSYIAVK